MGRTVFQVTLGLFRCLALSCGNAKRTYLKVNFAGGYKSLQSEASEDHTYFFGAASSFIFSTCVPVLVASQVIVRLDQRSFTAFTVPI
jgi:hypothetical protein